MANFTFTLPTGSVESKGMVVDLDDIPWSSDFVAKAVIQGIAVKLQRSDASAKDPAAARRRVRDMLQNGEWRGSVAGHSGGRLDPVEIEWRALLEAKLRATGMKAGEAKKASTDFDSATETLVIAAIGDETEDFDEKLERFRDAVLAAAKKAAEAKASAIDELAID